MGFHRNADRLCYCPAGAASIGKGIGGILFSRFSRSSGQVGGVEEEPSDSEGGASEVENVATGEEGVTVAESEEKEKQIEEERKEVEPAMSQSTSAVLDSTSCKYCGSAEQLYIRGSILFPPANFDYILLPLLCSPFFSRFQDNPFPYSLTQECSKGCEGSEGHGKYYLNVQNMCFDGYKK